MRDIFTVLGDAVKAVFRFVTNRILWLLIVTVVLFYLLATRLFELQIVLIDTYAATPPSTKTITVPLSAPRGTIYDSLGRPLAVNKLAYIVKIDPSITITNDALLTLARVLEQHDENFVDTFPIAIDNEVFRFTWADDEWREWRESRWKQDMTVANAETATAEETFAYLRKQFALDPSLSDADARKILNLRCMIYMQRYDPIPVTLAYDIKPETLSVIEEENMLFAGVSLEIQSLREYPQGIYFSHMLGYTGRINDTEYEANKEKGYTTQDIIGKAGLEKSMESWLRGKNGTQTIEVYSVTGRRTGTEPVVTEPEPGSKIFLTVDTYLQQRTYEILYDMLCQILINKIKGTNPREDPITQKQIFKALVNSNNIPLKQILEAPKDSETYALRQYIFDRFPEANIATTESTNKIKTILTDGIEAGRISSATMLVTMIDLGILTDTDNLTVRLKKGLSTQQVIIDKIQAGELTPQMLNLDPCSGSVVVVDVHNGDVLAAVTYPSYDNNRLVNQMDNAYYYQINRDDPTNPMIYRPFQEARAPGSTFKMITATAALETGAITPSVAIRDENAFTKAGTPYTRCWSTSSHGYINVAQALQVSCNYFFCEAAYRLGNTKSGTKIEGINILNAYMKFFGLNEKTGVEIGERYDAYSDSLLKISSPEFKEYLFKSYNPDASKADWDWYDGDTVKTAIGQGYNDYTPAMMARYISVIANRGTRYPLHLVNTVESAQQEVLMQYEAVPDYTGLTVSDKTWDTIIEGMRLVTEGVTGRTGTGVNVFRDFPIRVAGKTGTAQQVTSRNDHSSFGGFAPYEDPQIAVYVSIPFGDTRTLSAPASQVARDVIGEYMGLNAQPEYPEPVNGMTR